MGARNRVGLGLPYRPARLNRPAESIPRNRFLGSLKALKIPSQRLSTRSTGNGFFYMPENAPYLNICQ
jgi:hypothetical protein